MFRITVTIEGSNWQDIQVMELPEVPREGDAIETRYGTCIVTRADPLPGTGERVGKVVCRFQSAPG